MKNRKQTGRRGEEGEESIHISICEMCQTPILFAQYNNSSAKATRGDTKIYLLKHRTDFFFFFKLSTEFSGFNCLNSTGKQYFRTEQKPHKFSFLRSSTGYWGRWGAVEGEAEEGRVSTYIVYDTTCSH